MKQEYVPKSFRAETLGLIRTMNEIIDDLQAQGFRLTVRQLYYQLVAKDIIANNLAEYKRIAGLINDAKLAGLIDWEAMEDRTREFVRRTRWSSGEHILKACIQSYHIDMWDNQSSRVFVVIEKEALVGILEPTCHAWDIPLLAARGYPSGTVLREFAQSDLISCMNQGQTPIIFHLGDHDPSGIDMSRDLEERLDLFTSHCADEVVLLQRLALNMPQIEEINPPENPAKVTDSRFASYMKKFGRKSWELDALSPTYIANLLEENITQYVDLDDWKLKEGEVAKTKKKILELSRQFKD